MEPAFPEYERKPMQVVAGSLPPLAIVGFSFRFPQDAVTSKAFWKMLVEKKCASTETPPDRWRVDTHYHPDNNRTENISTRGGHYMTGNVAAFDAPFFSLSTAEVEAMDPSQRLTLETAYRALENAGIPIEKIANTKTCVYSGSSSRDYSTILDHDPDMQPKYRATGTATNMLANRVSWFFDLTGPSVNVDTACSSSLVALDLTCQSIWAGDSTAGLACGSNIMLTPGAGMSLDNLGLLGADRLCYSFDHRANGYSRGEGIGVIVVKPLNTALRDGDTIRAVIRSSCSNQDGKTSGVTLPSREAQERLIIDTYAKAGLDMRATRYFEAHGTGTPVGDPIEVGAIGAAFRKYRSEVEPLYIGSVKSNIGHLEGAAGVAGVIKAVLALETGVIPPNSNFEKLNPKIDAEFWRIKIATELTSWPTNGLRRASVQSFGFGGTNSHVVLDDAYNFLRAHGLRGNHNTLPVPSKTSKDLMEVLERRHALNDSEDCSTDSATHTTICPKLLVWSTMDENGIGRLKGIWKEYLSDLKLPRKQADVYIRDLAHTLAVRRSQFPWRTFAVANTENVVSLADRFIGPMRANSNRNLCFVFSGQGAQWYAMGRELLSRYPVYRNSLLESGLYLGGLGCQWNPIEELSKDEHYSNVNDAYYSQSLCTILQVALVDIMTSFGVRPASVVGHSSGEIAAAFCIGAISRQAAWKIAYFRGIVAKRLVESSKVKGGMIAVTLSASVAEDYLQRLSKKLGERLLVVACVNSPNNVTISGDVGHLAHLQEALEEAQIVTRKLKVDVAYHSFQMHEVADEYTQKLGRLKKPHALAANAPTMVSTVTGDWITPEALADPQYWAQNLVSPVLFFPALATLCSRMVSTSPSKAAAVKLDGSHRYQVYINDIIELGPHSALQSPIKECLKSMRKDHAVTYMSILVRSLSAVESTLEAAGRLHCLGYPVDIQRINQEPIERKEGENMKYSRKSLVTLPEYPFNHNKSYWIESRFSKSYRFRDNPKHELLGVQVIDWNPLEAKWKNTIKLSELPWLEDHRINDTILYPAAGMLVMAIEACKQLSDSSRKVSGFLFKNVSFHAALSIPANSSGIEVSLYVRPRKKQNEKDSGWHNFQLYTCNSVIGWQENCNGSIQIVYDTPKTDVDNGREQKEWVSARQERYLNGVNSCVNEVVVQDFYNHLAFSGYGYGRTFRLITRLHHNNFNAAMSEIEIFRRSNYYEGADYDQQHVVHPTTLDCILQGNLTIGTKGCTSKIPAAIPTHVQKLWISRHGLNCTDADLVKVYGTGCQTCMRETESHLIALDETKAKVLVDLECFRTTQITSSTCEIESEQVVKPSTCHTIDWKADIDLLSPQELQLFCRESVSPPYEPVEHFTEVDFLLTSCIRRSMRALGETEAIDQKPHFQMYFEWMKHRMELLDRSDSVFCSPQWQARLDDHDYIDRLSKKVANTSKQGLFYTTITLQHIKILTGEIDLLSLFFDGDLVKDHYYEILELTSMISRLSTLVDAMAHKNPGCKFLELGAGTGAMTHHLMKVLMNHSTGEPCLTPRFAQYYYTDISPSFFGPAKEIYGSNSRILFKSLDIERDPEAQGFEYGAYDGIFAMAVLHATTNLSRTLDHCRKLLKPGGRLIVCEPTMASLGLRTDFAFGLLEGWWLSTESYRKLSPCVSEHKWDELFKHAGFSGNDCLLYDYESTPCHEFTILVSTAVEIPPDPQVVPSTPAPDILLDTALNTVIVHRPDPNFEILARNLKSRLEGSFISQVRLSSFEHTLSEGLDSRNLFIFLLDLGPPVWFDISQEQFTSLQRILVTNLATKSIWISQDPSGSKDDPMTISPHYRLVDGLSRVLNSEADLPTFTSLTLQSEGISKGCNLSEKQMSHIIRLSNRLLASSMLSQETIETEYIERDGILYIPRLIETATLSKEIYQRITPRHSVKRRWDEPGGVPLKLVVGSPGLLNTLKFVEDNDQAQSLLPDEIEINVKAVGLNFRDLLVSLGQLQETLGCECVGILTRMGSAVPSGTFKLGDRVAMAAFDSYKSFARSDWRAAAYIPDEISISEAAAVAVNFTTAWLAFREIARLRPGETVLIHSAAGGTGQAAIQVARLMGATVLATVSTAKKVRFLMEKYNIKEEHIFSSRDSVSFARGVRRATFGKGVDVVLNSLSGKSLTESWECIAPYGRFIEIGKKDILTNNQLPMLPFLKNVSFTGLDLSSYTQDRPQVVGKALKEIFSHMAEGVLAPAEPLRRYGITEFETAFRAIQSGTTFGKIIVDMESSEQIMATVNNRPNFNFESNATYVIAGGIGGIGRKIAGWLVERGARNLILLSRSGSQNPHARSLVTELNSKGAKVVTPSCDISDNSALKAVIETCMMTGMPQIRGCIQSSMVLRDATFVSMTYESWQAATASKVQGSWNLHTLLPVDMDFFVMLSSIAGIIGSPGQANYAAGNTFQDALARYRIQKGQKGASLDLGPLFSMGVMTENKELQTRWRDLLENPVTEADLFALLDYHCNPAYDGGRDSPEVAPLRCQVVVGLGRQSSHKAAFFLRKPTFRSLVVDENMRAASGGAGERTAHQKVDFRMLFNNSTRSEASEAVSNELVRKLSSMLSLTENELDKEAPFHTYGVDSLVAVELRNWFAKEVEADISIFDILGGTTIATVSTLAATKSRYAKAEWSE